MEQEGYAELLQAVQVVQIHALLHGCLDHQLDAELLQAVHMCCLDD